MPQKIEPRRPPIIDFSVLDKQVKKLEFSPDATKEDRQYTDAHYNGKSAEISASMQEIWIDRMRCLLLNQTKSIQSRRRDCKRFLHRKTAEHPDKGKIADQLDKLYYKAEKQAKECIENRKAQIALQAREKKKPIKFIKRNMELLAGIVISLGVLYIGETKYKIREHLPFTDKCLRIVLAMGSAVLVTRISKTYFPFEQNPAIDNF